MSFLLNIKIKSCLIRYLELMDIKFSVHNLGLYLDNYGTFIFIPISKYYSIDTMFLQSKEDLLIFPYSFAQIDLFNCPFCLSRTGILTFEKVFSLFPHNHNKLISTKFKKDVDIACTSCVFSKMFEDSVESFYHTMNKLNTFGYCKRVINGNASFREALLYKQILGTNSFNLMKCNVDCLHFQKMNYYHEIQKIIKSLLIEEFNSQRFTLKVNHLFEFHKPKEYENKK